MPPSPAATAIPPEILVYICSFLADSEGERSLFGILFVNRTWFNAGVRTLWRRPPLNTRASQTGFLWTLRRADARAGSRAVTRTRRGGRATTTTTVATPRFRILRSLPCVIPYGSYVRVLNFAEAGGHITDQALFSVAQACPNLIAMNLESCDHITPRGVAAVIGSCERLEQIDLTGLRSFDDDGLHEAFAGVGERLNVVNLSLMGGATGEGIVRGLGHIKGLERLWLQYCGALEDEHVGMLTRVCEKLKDLYFLDCRKFTDQAMLYISNHLNTRLTQLTIGINDLITDHSISTLVRHCPNLRSITLALLRNISDSALHAIATHLPNITEFGVFSAHNITDAGVTSLATNCKNLERLCLYDCNVSSAGLIPVASNLEKLEYINIEHCERIQEATPELLVIWKRCDDFLANRALIRALHHYEFICAAADMHGVDKPVHLTFEFV